MYSGCIEEVHWLKMGLNNSSLLDTIKKQPPDEFYKKRVLKIFAKLTGKHFCQNLFFSKIAGLRSATLLKKRLRHRCFFVNFAKILTEQLGDGGLYPFRLYMFKQTCSSQLQVCLSMQSGVI